MSNKPIRLILDPVMFLEKLKQTYESHNKFIEMIPENPKLAVEFAKGWAKTGRTDNLTVEEAVKEIQLENLNFQRINFLLQDIQLISCDLFSAIDAIDSSGKHVSTLDYMLPYRRVMLFFQKPLSVQVDGKDEKIRAFLLSQDIILPDDTKRVLEYKKQNPFDLLELSPSAVKAAEQNQDLVMNFVGAIYEDFNNTCLQWQSGSRYEFSYDELGGSNEAVRGVHETLKKVAISIIGFINCENVVLRKRIAIHAPGISKKTIKKSPYYVCEIIKDFRASEERPTAEETSGHGGAHSFKYDVRGHFRKLTNGKTVWIKSHLRGLKNDTYLPKQYKLDDKLG